VFHVNLLKQIKNKREYYLRLPMLIKPQTQGAPPFPQNVSQNLFMIWP
jgi:hypothetical protein